MERVLIYAQTFYVVTDRNGIVLMKSNCESDCINWCKENGLEYKPSGK